MKQDMKKITFFLPNNTYELINNTAKEQYLSLSAYIRKAIDTYIRQEKTENELQ